METKEADVSQHLLHSISDNAWKVYCLSLIRIQTFMAIGFIPVNTGVLSVKKTYSGSKSKEVDTI